MKNNNNIILSLCIAISLLLINGCKPKVSEEFKRIASYPGAAKVEYYTYNRGLTQGIFYHVKKPYDSRELLEFYDARMSKEGYKPYVEEYYRYGDRQWRKFVDGTEKGEPWVAQLKASWIDPTGTKRANLVLRYYWYVDQRPDVLLGPNDDLQVDFQIMPFIKLPPPQ